MLEDGVRLTYVDDRNWAEYNERLVRRGDLYLNLDFLRNWDEEVSKMNKRKKGGHTNSLTHSSNSWPSSTFCSICPKITLIY